MEFDRLIDAYVQNAELLEYALLALPKSVSAELCVRIATKLLDRFERTGSMDDLDRATTTMEQAIAFTPKDHPNHVGMLSNMSGTWLIRFDRTGSVDDLDRAIEMMEQAVTSTSNDHPDLAAILSNLGNILQRRFERMGSIDDLDRAITTMEKAVASTPEDHPNQIRMLSNLGRALQSRFERTGSMDDLERAITMKKQVVASTPNDHPNLAAMLSNLGTALQSRFERTGSTDDLEWAITVKEQAVASTPNDHPNRAGQLSNLGSALQSRFERTGSMDDLERAITVKEQALASIPNDHPNRDAMNNNLGLALHSRFERTGSMDDLDRAIMMIEKSLTSAPNDHPSHASWLSNLGCALQTRFERMGSMDDLERAITTRAEAVASTPNDHPVKALYLNNLGGALLRRFERTGSMDDLDRAITTMEQAITSSPKDHPHMPMYFNNLGVVLQKRFERTGLMESIGQAITTMEQGVASTPNDHPDRAIYFNNLGNALHIQFEQTKWMDDLNQAIIMMEKAVTSSPNDHPNLGAMLSNLGNLLQRRFEQLGLTDDLDRAVMMMEQAVELDTAPSSFRIRAADSASQLLIGRNWERAKAILKVAVDLLPTISPRILNQRDRQYNIAQFAGITCRAVSVSLQCGEKPFQALQVSELGNGVLATLQLQVRSDVRDLQESHPDLARQFYDLRDQLDSVSNSFMQLAEHVSTSDSDYRRTLSNMFDKLLATVRKHDGFEQFLRAPSESELKALAVFGTIVVFNVSEIRSDAFIVTVDDIRLVSLPLLTPIELQAYTNMFLTSVSTVGLRQHETARRKIHKVLEWIWDVAVCPVLDELGFIQAGRCTSSWARVWWVGSGLLNILPIHAAGYHESTPIKNAIDRVISSYTPTIKALKYARERNIRVERVESQKAILIGMPKTPNQSDLPFVEQEISELNYLLCPHVQTTIIQKPNKENVISAMRDHQIVHFSCHGYSSAADPSQSKLLLNDWQDSPLTVSDLTALNVQMPQLAYLSACHSASARDISLLSESINLSSAIQLSGYPSVVGTLWQVEDNHSAEIAKDVYQQMLVGNKLDTLRSAESLHHAVRQLRDKIRTNPWFTKKLPDDPLVWASYVHTGV